MRLAVLTGAGLATCGCPPAGTIKYKGGPVTDAVVSLAAPSCPIVSPIGKTSHAATTMHMIHGRSDFSLLVVDSKGKGIEIENHRLEAGEHVFEVWHRKAKAWVYRFPDVQGEPGHLDYYETFTVSKTPPPGGAHIQGTLLQTCELVVSAVGTVQEAGPPAAAPMPPTPLPATCVPGESKACAGPGACSGYQTCSADGLSFGACQCIPSAPPEPAAEPADGDANATEEAP